jgi:hypothetical protein
MLRIRFFACFGFLKSFDKKIKVAIKAMGVISELSYELPSASADGIEVKYKNTQ